MPRLKKYGAADKNKPFSDLSDAKPWTRTAALMARDDVDGADGNQSAEREHPLALISICCPEGVPDIDSVQEQGGFAAKPVRPGVGLGHSHWPS